MLGRDGAAGSAAIDLAGPANSPMMTPAPWSDHRAQAESFMQNPMDVLPGSTFRTIAKVCTTTTATNAITNTRQHGLESVSRSPDGGCGG
jgi:hypothetical protein